MQSLMVLVLALAITIQSNCTCNWIVPSLQSTEVHNEAGQLLESIGRAEEVSFEFKVKDSLSEGIADMREYGIPNGGTGDRKCLQAKDKTSARKKPNFQLRRERSGL